MLVKEFAQSMRHHSQNPEKDISIKASPTGRLIDFRKRRSATKKVLAQRLTPQRSFERLIVYSNNPKVNFETSMKKLEEVKDREIRRKEGNDYVIKQMEKDLANDLLPILHEKVEGM
eukprot:TRINITY_DN4313_c0_g1_i10.p2 TRINITY_DN4313_c0_g1~~TRINITY_DN4313_c0_g1_i10.p2  ORF type:complete len:117 (-),score=34.52 TRINITY_DN4313_c0_g1_i10:247-597(-)